jgi:histidine kinase
MKRLHAPHPGFWRFQIFGWLAFAIVTIVGLLPLHEEKWVYIYYSTLTISGFFCSLVLRRICRRTWVAGLSWRSVWRVILACYPLAYVTTIGAFCLERRIRSNNLHPKGWSEVFLSAFGDTSTAFVLLVGWSGIYFFVKQWQASRLREERLLRLEAMARASELRALRYQITPHFLFNTLNGISTLVGEEDNLGARQMIALLGDFLRTTLETSQSGDVTLRHEIRHMEQYLAIEQVRFGDRLRLKVAVEPGAESALIPNLLLQPLIENAIRHGIARCTPYGELTILTSRNGGHVTITISNTLGSVQKSIQPDVARSSGLGLTNTRERLTVRFGQDQSLKIVREVPTTWTVLLTIPYDTGGANENPDRR